MARDRVAKIPGRRERGVQAATAAGDRGEGSTTGTVDREGPQIDDAAAVISGAVQAPASTRESDRPRIEQNEGRGEDQEAGATVGSRRPAARELGRCMKRERDRHLHGTEHHT